MRTRQEKLKKARRVSKRWKDKAFNSKNYRYNKTSVREVLEKQKSEAGLAWLKLFHLAPIR